MTRKDKIKYVICAIILAVGIGAILWVFITANWSAFTDTLQESNDQCSFGRKCIVNEWSPKCLWFECIIDGRKQ